MVALKRRPPQGAEGNVIGAAAISQMMPPPAHFGRTSLQIPTVAAGSGAAQDDDTRRRIHSASPATGLCLRCGEGRFEVMIHAPGNPGPEAIQDPFHPLAIGPIADPRHSHTNGRRRGVPCRQVPELGLELRVGDQSEVGRPPLSPHQGLSRPIGRQKVNAKVPTTSDGEVMPFMRRPSPAAKST